MQRRLRPLGCPLHGTSLWGHSFARPDQRRLPSLDWCPVGLIVGTWLAFVERTPVRWQRGDAGSARPVAEAMRAAGVNAAPPTAPPAWVTVVSTCLDHAID